MNNPEELEHRNDGNVVLDVSPNEPSMALKWVPRAKEEGAKVPSSASEAYARFASEEVATVNLSQVVDGSIIFSDPPSFVKSYWDKLAEYMEDDTIYLPASMNRCPQTAKVLKDIGESLNIQLGVTKGDGIAEFHCLDDLSSASSNQILKAFKILAIYIAGIYRLPSLPRRRLTINGTASILVHRRWYVALARYEGKDIDAVYKGFSYTVDEQSVFKDLPAEMRAEIGRLVAIVRMLYEHRVSQLSDNEKQIIRLRAAQMGGNMGSILKKNSNVEARSRTVTIKTYNQKGELSEHKKTVLQKVEVPPCVYTSYKGCELPTEVKYISAVNREITASINGLSDSGMVLALPENRTKIVRTILKPLYEFTSGINNELRDRKQRIRAACRVAPENLLENGRINPVRWAEIRDECASRTPLTSLLRNEDEIRDFVRGCFLSAARECNSLIFTAAEILDALKAAGASEMQDVQLHQADSEPEGLETDIDPNQD